MLAKDLIDVILDKPINWIDWSKMPPEEREAWGNTAKAVLENKAFISLVGDRESSGEIVKRVIEAIARRSDSHEQTENLRHIICGAELIKELLWEMVVIPEKPTTKDDIHSAI